MYICERCGKLHTEEDFNTYPQDYGAGEYIDFSCTSCGADCNEANCCKICDDFFDTKDHPYSICEKCLKENATVENAFAMGEDNKEFVKINGFLYHIFNAKDIEDILKKVALERLSTLEDEAIEYCFQDPIGYNEWLERRV